MACRIHNILDTRTDSEKMLHHGISLKKDPILQWLYVPISFLSLNSHRSFRMAKKTTNELSALVSIYNDRWRQYSFAIMPSVDNMSNVSLDLLFVVCWQCSLGTYLNTYLRYLFICNLSKNWPKLQSSC